VFSCGGFDLLFLEEKKQKNFNMGVFFCGAQREGKFRKTRRTAKGQGEGLVATRSRSGENSYQLFSNTLAPLRYVVTYVEPRSRSNAVLRNFNRGD